MFRPFPCPGFHFKESDERESDSEPVCMGRLWTDSDRLYRTTLLSTSVWGNGQSGPARLSFTVVPEFLFHLKFSRWTLETTSLSFCTFCF